MALGPSRIASTSYHASKARKFSNLMQVASHANSHVYTKAASSRSRSRVALEKHSFSLTVKLDTAFSKSLVKPIIARADTCGIQAAPPIAAFLSQDRIVINF